MGNLQTGLVALKSLAWRVANPKKPAFSDLVRSVPSPVRTLFKTVKPYTMVDRLRLAMLYQLTRETRVPGDVVECGVCNGGSAAVLASAIRSDPSKCIWLYDTFRGIPPPASIDGPDAPAFAGKLVGSVARVKEVLALVQFPEERTIIREGLFRDTFKQPLPKRVAVLHVDADWYEGVLEALTTFYPLIPDGGVVVLDDFGDWEGCREAFYEFCLRFNNKPVLERVGHTQAFWRKGQTHNRLMAKRFPRGIYGLGAE